VTGGSVGSVLGPRTTFHGVAWTLTDGGATTNRNVSRFANVVGVGGVFRNLELSVSLCVRPTQLTAYIDLSVRDAVTVEVCNVKLQECIILIDRSAFEGFHLNNDTHWTGDTEEMRRDYLLITGNFNADLVLCGIKARVFFEVDNVIYPVGSVWFTTSLQGDSSCIFNYDTRIVE